MAIEKKLICFARLAEFERQLAAGNILDYSIVFIQDAKKIWNRGTYYDCSTLTESTISEWGFTKNTGTYSKPNGGIPKSDLASAVQTSLGKADTALQSYTEQYKGTVTGVKMNGASKGTSGVVDLGNVVTSVKINGLGKTPSSGVVDLGTVITEHQDISGKQDKLVSGTNIKTINNQSIVGSGNITISGSGEANVQSDWNVTDTSSDAYIKNKPTIPAAVTESTVSGWGFTKNTGTYSKPSTGIPKTDLSGEVQTALNKASSALQAESFRGTVTKVKINGSEKAPDSSGVVDLGDIATKDDIDILNDINQDIANLYDVKQDVLVSGTNIKTVNGSSILGSGDITIEGGGGISDVQVDNTSVVTNGVAKIRKATIAALGVTKLNTATDSTSFTEAATPSAVKKAYDLANGKQDALVSGTNIKTINGESILGSGNISISGGSGGEDIRYFTEFTVSEFIEACENEETIYSSGLYDAIMNNKIICIPYSFESSGAIIATSRYTYSDATGLHSFSCFLEYNQITYEATCESPQIDDDVLYGFLPKSKAHRAIICDNLIELEDNVTYIIINKVNELMIYFHGYMGSTIRFQTGDNPVLEFMDDILWLNGVVPEIVPNTYYELSLASDYYANLFAVLTPFKSVE